MRGLKHLTQGQDWNQVVVASFTDAWIETYCFGSKPQCELSHLLQMRGLKLYELDGNVEGRPVASFTDAWIETKIREHGRKKRVVASFTDAWIETLNNRFCPSSLGSHLLQMRGLKRFWGGIGSNRCGRIFYRCVDWNQHVGFERLGCAYWSHLLQMRGLKPTGRPNGRNEPGVASFTDAWIETQLFEWEFNRDMSHLLQMRGLKRCKIQREDCPGMSHLLQMRGLKPTQMATEILGDSRIFYRCVDWNKMRFYFILSS